MCKLFEELVGRQISWYCKNFLEPLISIFHCAFHGHGRHKFDTVWAADFVTPAGSSAFSLILADSAEINIK
jgi:hypothetical protein